MIGASVIVRTNISGGRIVGLTKMCGGTGGLGLAGTAGSIGINGSGFLGAFGSRKS